MRADGEGVQAGKAAKLAASAADAVKTGRALDAAKGAAEVVATGGALDLARGTMQAVVAAAAPPSSTPPPHTGHAPYSAVAPKAASAHPSPASTSTSGHPPPAESPSASPRAPAATTPPSARESAAKKPGSRLAALKAKVQAEKSRAQQLREGLGMEPGQGSEVTPEGAPAPSTGPLLQPQPRPSPEALARRSVPERPEGPLTKDPQAGPVEHPSPSGTHQKSGAAAARSLPSVEALQREAREARLQVAALEDAHEADHAVWRSELAQKNRALEALHGELEEERRSRPQGTSLGGAGGEGRGSEEALMAASRRAKAAEEEARRLRLAAEGLHEDGRRREESLRETHAAREAELERELEGLRREEAELRRAAELAREGQREAEDALRETVKEGQRRLQDVQEEAELRAAALREQLETSLAGGEEAGVAAEEVRQLRAALELEREERQQEEATALKTAEGHAREIQELQEDARAREGTLRTQVQAAMLEASQREPEGEAVGRLRQELTAAGAALAAEQEARERAERAAEKARKHLMEREAEEEERDAYMASLEEQVQLAQNQAAEARRSAESDEKVTELQVSLEEARWAASAHQTALAERETELQRLQAVLGQLSADSELLEEREAELATAARQIEEAEAQRDAAKGAAKVAADETAAARQDTRRALEGQVQLRERCGALHEDTFKLKKALEDAYRQIKDSQLSSGQMVDRQIVGKLLLTYFEREQAPEVLAVMMGVLAMGEEAKARVQAEHLRARKGLLKTVSRAPIALVKGGLQLAAKPLEIGASPQPGDATMGDMWLDFLTQEMEAEADGAPGAASTPPPPKLASGGSPAVVPLGAPAGGAEASPGTTPTEYNSVPI